MSRWRLRTAAVAAWALLLLACPRPGFAWGCRGHRIVAYIALAHLRPEVAAKVNQILLASPAVPSRRGRHARSRCGRANVPAMVRAAPWADSVRTRLTAPLHYVDVPVGARRRSFHFRTVCAAGCVTAAIARDWAAFSRTRDARRKAGLLRYLIHFAGDVSQPLHDSDDRDRGGNCVETRVAGRRGRSNLHADWDWVFLQAYEGGQSNAAFAARLDREWGGRLRVRSLDPRDWAWQGYEVADQDVFQALRLEPGCRRRPVRISAAYLKRIRPVLEKQLVLGGLRLAALLNSGRW